MTWTMEDWLVGYLYSHMGAYDNNGKKKYDIDFKCT